jgi:PKD domain
MHHTKSLRLMAGLGVLVVAAACEGSPDPLATPEAPAPQFSQVQSGAEPDQHALGQAIPAFGGLFLDGGVPTAYLTDAAARPGLERALANFLSARGVQAAQLRVRQGRFTWAELESVFDRARPSVFDGPGTVFADLDEARNIVAIGVENGGAEARVRAALGTLGLPEGSVVIERAAPIVALQTLRDRFDPIPGGVQIHFGQYLCSIGVIAMSGNQLGFVTASHCTNTQGGTEGTVYYQPLSSTDNTVIGTEALDPVYYNRRQGPCPYAGVQCRRSDAAFIASSGARAMQLGSIAQVNGNTLDFSGTYYTINSVAGGNGVVGDRRDKVGRTTGHTFGTITNSCVDTGVSGSNKVLLCQDFVSSSSVIVLGGDSGSNVFSGSGNVTWAGQLWGGNSDGTMFVYSPAKNVLDELGALTVTGTGGGGGGGGGGSTLVASFTYSCHFGDCTFDATRSTGVDPDGYSWAFSEGGSASGAIVNHTYTAGGTYGVTLTVTDGSAEDMTSRNVQCQTKGRNLQCK